MFETIYAGARHNFKHCSKLVCPQIIVNSVVWTFLIKTTKRSDNPKFVMLSLEILHVEALIGLELFQKEALHESNRT
jgi:hypothetical protein